jgi:hypothetical protein
MSNRGSPSPCTSYSMVMPFAGAAVMSCQAIAAAAETQVDSYHFDASDALRHIATEGTTDTALTLHGPDDPGAILSWDDDRGRDQNARIVRKLEPGSYWLTVRQKQPGGTGTYTGGVKTYRR